MRSYDLSVETYTEGSNLAQESKNDSKGGYPWREVFISKKNNPFKRSRLNSPSVASIIVGELSSISNQTYWLDSNFFFAASVINFTWSAPVTPTNIILIELDDIDSMQPLISL